MVLSLDFQCKEDTMYKRMVRLMVDRTIYTGVKNTGIIHKHKVSQSCDQVWNGHHCGTNWLDGKLVLKPCVCD